MESRICEHFLGVLRPLALRDIILAELLLYLACKAVVLDISMLRICVWESDRVQKLIYVSFMCEGLFLSCEGKFYFGILSPGPNPCVGRVVWEAVVRRGNAV